MKRLCLIVVAALPMLSCGYHLAGTGNFLPPTLKKVGVPTFKNMTARYELDQKLTTAVINELTSRTRYEIVPDATGVDAVMNVTINLYLDQPVAFSGSSRSRQYQIRIGASIELRDSAKNDVLYSNPSFVSPPYPYDLPEGGGDAFQAQTEALNQAVLDFARRLVSTMLEGF